jgi:hypothetical protein
MEPKMRDMNGQRCQMCNRGTYYAKRIPQGETWVSGYRGGEPEMVSCYCGHTVRRHSAENPNENKVVTDGVDK